VQTFTESILITIENHAEWAWFFVFLIAFIESMAVIGILMPGWVLLVGIGTMVGADVLSFTPIVLSAYFGAVIGEYLSYSLGYHYHHQILHWKWLSKHQKLIDYSKEFFEKHGVAGVFFGRFIGPVRAFIPLIAGISEMPKRTFFWVNITSGLFWAPLYLIPGILIGAAFDLEKETATSILFIVIIIALVFWMTINQSATLLKVINGLLQRNLTFAVINALLSWVLLITLLVILINSQFYPPIEAIFSILLDKLFKF